MFVLSDNSMDSPWYGDSSHPLSERGPTADLFEDVLEEIVTSLNIPPAILSGNSVGGFNAAKLAIRHPECVDGLILVNAGGFVAWDAISKSFTRLFGVPLLNKWIMPSLV